MSPHRICFCSLSSTEQHQRTAKSQSLGVNGLDFGHGGENTSRAQSNTGKRHGLASENPESPSEKPPPGCLGIRDTLWGGGTPSPADMGVAGAFPTHQHHLPRTPDPPTIQPAGLNPQETPEMRHSLQITPSCIKSSPSLYKVHENLGKICIAIHTPASVLGGSS